MGWDAGYYYLLRTFLYPPATAAAAATRNAPLLLCWACNQTRTDQTATAPPTSCTKYPALPPFGVLLSIKVPFSLSLSSHPLPISPSPLPPPLFFQAIPCSWPIYRNPRHFLEKTTTTEYGVRSTTTTTNHLLRSSNCYLRFQCPSPLTPTQAQHKHKHTRALAAASQLLVAP